MCVIWTAILTPLPSQSCDPDCDIVYTDTVGSGFSSAKEYATTSGLPSSPNGNIVVCGVFHIDKDISTNNLTVYLLPDSEIIIDEGNTLQSVNTIFIGCGGMWKHITVKSGARFYAYNSEFYDSYISAVRSEAGSSFFTIGGIFERNYWSIDVPDGTPNLAVLSNKIIATPFIFSFPTGGTGVNEGYPYLGINLNNTASSIGTGGSLGSILSPNQIQGRFHTGIRFDDSNVDIINNEFTDISFQRQGQSIWRGFGVTGNFGISNAKVLGNSFSNCFQGISLINGTASLEAQFNSFEQYGFAIFINATGPTFSSIRNNYIGTDNASGNYGVNLGNTNATITTSNNICVANSEDGQWGTSGGTYSIKHQSLTGSSSEVKDNSITIRGAGTDANIGIWDLAERGSLIDGNQISIETEGTEAYGIFLENATHGGVISYKVIGDQAGTNEGIRAINAALNRYVCNKDSLLHFGLSFIDYCDNSEVLSTEIHDCHIGLNLSQDCVTGPQYLTGNRWRGTFSTYGARNENSLFSIVRGSQFTVINTTQPEGPGSSTPPGWFITNPFADDTPCGSLTANDLDEEISPIITPYDTLIASGYMDTIWDEGDAWIAKRQLYSKMLNNSGLYGDYGVTDDWYDDQSGGIIESYQLKRDSILGIFDVSIAQQDTLDRALDSIDSYRNVLHYYDSLIVFDTITQWANFDSGRFETLMTIDSFFQIYQGTVENILAARYAKAQHLISTNSALSAPDLPIRCERNVHDILLRTIASNVDTFSTTQIDTLLNIAGSCPAEAGQAVYWAAALYQYVEPMNFDIESNCTPPSSLVRPGSMVTRKATQRLRVHPSPAQDYLYLADWREINDDHATIQILSLSGQVIWTGRPGILGRIDVSDLQNG